MLQGTLGCKSVVSGQPCVRPPGEHGAPAAPPWRWALGAEHGAGVLFYCVALLRIPAGAPRPAASGKQVVAGSGEDERGTLSPWQTPGLKAGHRQDIFQLYTSLKRWCVGQIMSF